MSEPTGSTGVWVRTSSCVRVARQQAGVREAELERRLSELEAQSAAERSRLAREASDLRVRAQDEAEEVLRRAEAARAALAKREAEAVRDAGRAELEAARRRLRAAPAPLPPSLEARLTKPVALPQSTTAPPRDGDLEANANLAEVVQFM